MKTPETSRLFSPWKNPSNGVVSHILTERPASVQTNFYFTNPSFTNDGRFLWVMCQFVPPNGKGAVPVLAVVDFERDEMRVCHETQITVGRPVVDLDNGDVYWFSGNNLYRRGPGAGDVAVRINRFPQDIAKGRTAERIATHLFFSADKKSVNIDARFPPEFYIGDLPLDGSPTRIWQTMEGYFDHAQFSPTDPDVILFAHEYWQEASSGKFDGSTPYHRLWIIRRGGKAEPLLREPVSHSGHEWWDSDGKHVWYVHYGVGIKKVNLQTRREELVWPGHLAHGYSDRSGRYLAADMMSDPVVCDCHVEFFNTATGKQVEICNRPPLAADLTQCGHLHPHPTFCHQDRYICYTTTVQDRVDFALAPTADLIARTS